MEESVNPTEHWQRMVSENQKTIKRIEKERADADRRGDHECAQRIDDSLSKQRTLLAKNLRGQEAARQRKWVKLPKADS